jgi:hypothetical protein
MQSLFGPLGHVIVGGCNLKQRALGFRAGHLLGNQPNFFGPNAPIPWIVGVHLSVFSGF